MTFDAELAPALVGERFGEVEVERWDAPLLRLPDQATVRDYLIGKGVPASTAARRAAEVRVPLTVTKRGALAFGRKEAEAPTGIEPV